MKEQKSKKLISSRERVIFKEDYRPILLDLCQQLVEKNVNNLFQFILSRVDMGNKIMPKEFIFEILHEVWFITSIPDFYDVPINGSKTERKQRQKKRKGIRDNFVPSEATEIFFNKYYYLIVEFYDTRVGILRVLRKDTIKQFEKENLVN